MEQVRRYIDASVILNAFSDNVAIAKQATSALAWSDGKLIAGDYVKLETFPKTVFNKQEEQQAFLEKFFQEVVYVPSSAAIVAEAEKIAEQYGLSAMDALHAASAIEGGADELLTFEKPSKPFFRIPPSVLKVVSLHAD